jgi:hypothetical protein
MYLTRRQREVLTKLRDEPDCDLAVSGLECWVGNEKTSLALAYALLRLMLLSPVDMGGSAAYYEINESGRRALDGLPPYRDASGQYHDSVAALLVLQDERAKENAEL